MMKLASGMGWGALETDARGVACWWPSAGCLWGLRKVHLDLEDVTVN